MTERLVYKYVTADRIDVLKDARIRFTQPEALNDPFESSPSLVLFGEQVKEELLSRAEEYGTLTLDQIRRVTDEFMPVFTNVLPTKLGQMFAFLSVSKLPDNLLMWSHYADSHRGFLIGFDADNRFFAPGGLAVHGLRDVEYSADRFNVPRRGFGGLTPHEGEESLQRVFFSKSLDWKYEFEMRMVTESRRADRVIPLAGQPPIYLFNFPPEAIRKVVLGYKMLPDRKEELAGLLDEKYPHVQLLQATASDVKYELNFQTYTEFKQYDRILKPLRMRLIEEFMRLPQMEESHGADETIESPK